MRWFLPEGRLRPAHLPPVEITGSVSVIAGPDGKPGCVRGGLFTPGEPGWIEIPDERPWWINPQGSSPGRLLRLDARMGVEIAGVEPEHRWLIPTLLRPVAGGLVWSGDERLVGSSWRVPPPPEPWQTIGLHLRDPLARGSWEELGDEGTTDLALRLIASNYHLDPAELRVSGWMSKAMISSSIAATIEGADP
ncbi:MAG: hypothetical protein RL456_3460 [Pseudomonadota bacterium]|jgi:hypothetical protein